MKKKYESYKDSGIPWLGEVPEHWLNRKIGREYPSLGSGTTPKSSERKYYQGGTYNWILTGDLNDGKLEQSSRKITDKAINDCSLKFYSKGSVVMALYGATIGRLAILNCSASTNQACCVLPESRSMSNKFIFYWLMANRRHIISLAYGGGQPNISQEIVRGLIVPSPNQKEQTQIAKFLDYKTNQINQLISKKEELIKLLKEERTAVINQTVTKGLDPDVPMKDSGVEWLGEIPEHWEVRKISRSFSLIGSGTTPKSGEKKYYDNGEYNWVLTGELNDGVLNATSKKVTKKALEDYSSLKFYPKSSVVMAMYGATIGKLSILNIEACTNQACCVLSRSEFLENEFVFFWLLANRKHIISLSYGGGQPNISQETVKELKIPCPDKKEQNKILAFIKSNISRIDRTIFNIQKEIKLINEFKTSLINEAVTGKIDVRDYKLEKEVVTL